jgi:hypothetical protein
MKDNNLKNKNLNIENSPEESEEVLKPMYLEGHVPKTRREFMAQGFLGMTAFALAPSLLSMLSNSAYAQTTGCAAPTRVGMMPVIIIDLAGGGNIAGSNVMVGGAGGQLDFLPSYATLGLPPDFHPSLARQTNNEMGLVFHADSGVLRGIQSIASTTTRANAEGTIFCSTSSDDTANNQSNPMYWLAKAGAVGDLRPIAGTNATTSGGNSRNPLESIDPSITPVKISSSQDAINLVSLGNRFAEFSNNATSSAIIDTAAKLSSKKIETIGRRSLPQKIKELLNCSYNQTNDQLQKYTPDGVDPDKDTQATTVFNRITNQGIRNKSKAIVNLVLDGYVGAGTIVLGGYDYHNNSRARGEAADFDLGQVMGAIMELASLKKKDVAIYVLTDGGVVSGGGMIVDNSAGGRGKYGWSSDSGQRSSTFMMVYKRDGKPSLRTDNRQIGHFKTNGAVEGSALLTSNSVVNTSKAMVANYLALHGMESKLEQIIGDDPFKRSLDRYLVFNKIR